MFVNFAAYVEATLEPFKSKYVHFQSVCVVKSG